MRAYRGNIPHNEKKMRNMERIIMAVIWVCMLLATVISASAADIEFVTPKTWKVTMYDTQELSKDYMLESQVSYPLTDCMIVPSALQQHITVFPEQDDVIGQSKFRVTVSRPPVGEHKIVLGVSCSNSNFSFNSSQYSPSLVLNVLEDKGACNIRISKPLSKYISFIGLPGTLSGSSPVVIVNSMPEHDNFTFALSGLDCSLNAVNASVNGESQFLNSVSNCTFMDSDVDGKLVVTSSRCDTAVNIRLSNSIGGHYFGLMKQYKWWVALAVGGVLAVAVMLTLILISKR
jgi:hypothetical protein